MVEEKAVLKVLQQHQFQCGTLDAVVTDIVRLLHKKERTLKSMKERHDNEIEELQHRCSHSKVSKWLEEWWAIAHSTGMRVKVCEYCNKEMNREVWCYICGKKMTNYKWEEHFGELYCKTCSPDWETLRAKKFEKDFGILVSDDETQAIKKFDEGKKK